MLSHIGWLLADSIWLFVAIYCTIMNRRIKRNAKRVKKMLEQVNNIQPSMPLIEYARYLVLNKHNMN